MAVELFERIKDNPAGADGAVAIDGLASLLKSGIEQARIAEIVEESSVLNLNRFAGRKVKVEGSEGSIRVEGYKPGMGFATGRYVTISETATFAKGDISALKPSRGRIDLSHLPLAGALGFANETYYHVFPFDNDGQQIAQFEIK